jgi:hypothetical protein
MQFEVIEWIGAGLLLLTLLGHEKESRVTSVSGNVLDHLNISLRPFNYGHITEKWNSSSTSNLHVEHVLLYQHCSSVILLLLILNFENEFKRNHG